MEVLDLKKIAEQAIALHQQGNLIFDRRVLHAGFPILRKGATKSVANAPR